MSDVVIIPALPHSDVGPSSFERVEACTASAILGKGLAQFGSPYAAEGTMMHYVMERCLVDGDDVWDFIGDLFQLGDAGPEEEPMLFTAELADAVQMAVSFARKFRAEKWVERKLSLPGGVAWGYADLVVLDKPLVVMDLKGGKGILVPADAPQLGLYAVMALIEREGVDHLREGDPEKVLALAMVLQPRDRGQQMKSHPWTRGSLLDLYLRWVGVLNDVRERRIRYHVSDKCRFCNAVAICPALRVAAKDGVLSTMVLDPVALEETGFDASVLDEALRQLPALDLYGRKLTDLAMRYMERGGRLESVKLVQKRALRQWVDEEKAKAWLSEVLPTPYQEPKLLSPNMAEGVLPKGLRHHTHPSDDPDALGLVVKQSSGLTMAPRDDPKPEVTLRKGAYDTGLIQDTARRLLNRAKSLETEGTDE